MYRVLPIADPVGSDTLTAGSKGGVTVDARFDAGYFVTVKIAKQEFQGILYYPPPEHTQVVASLAAGHAIHEHLRCLAPG